MFFSYSKLFSYLCKRNIFDLKLKILPVVEVREDFCHFFCNKFGGYYFYYYFCISFKLKIDRFMKYTKMQLEIGDCILKRIADDGNYTDRRFLIGELQDKYGYTPDPEYMMMSLEEDLGYIRKWGQTLVTITADGLQAKKYKLKRALLFRSLVKKSVSWAQVIVFLVGVAGGLIGILK